MIGVIALALLTGAAPDGIRRLPPSSFKELPDEVRDELNRRRCTIPQSYAFKRPHNVISGEFARRGQTDWAVLCSKRGISSILVFWNGSADSVATIAPQKDEYQIVRDFDSGKAVFSRAIDVVGKKYIDVHNAGIGVWVPPKIDHQGINDAFLEKASEVYYFYRGKWLKLPGAD